jgi:hypothetical protein
MRSHLLAVLACQLACQGVLADTLITGTFGGAIAPAVTFGYAFSFDRDVSVFGVGIFDAGDNGLAGTNRLGIWTDTGALLVSKLFDSTTSPTLESHFRWLTLDTPLTLNANTIYRTGVFGSESGLQGSVQAASLSADITFIAEVGSSSGSFSFPNSSTLRTAGSAYIGPNLEFTIVPEPSVGALLGTAILGLICRNKQARPGPTRRPHLTAARSFRS